MFLWKVMKYSGIRQWLWLQNVFPGGTMIKNLPANTGGETDVSSSGFNPWLGNIPWRRKWQTTPVLLPGKSHGQRSLAGYSPGGCKQSDMTERLHFHFSLCIGEGRWQHTPVFLPGESQGRWSLVGYCLWGRTESDTTEAT